MKNLTKNQIEWLNKALNLPEGEAYSSDNEDHDLLFENNLIEAIQTAYVDWYGCYVRVTDKGRKLIESMSDVGRGV